jgi:TRAP-type mannitol/chloroaromatic compound transport system substrate-binding protein
LSKICEEITLASNGRLELSVFPGGGIVPAETEFDAVDVGTLQFGVNVPMYWKTYFPAASLFAYVSGGLSPIEFLSWMDAEGAALMDKMVEGYNVHVISGASAMTTPEVFMHSKKEVKTVADLKGLKMRGAGDGAEILGNMGAAMTHFPSSEIYESAERGVIDAFECASPQKNWNMGLQEIAQYVYLSGSRQGMQYDCFFVNKDSWEELTPDLQVMITDMARSNTARTYYEYLTADMQAVTKFIDYGCTVEALSPELEDAYAEAAKEFYAEACAKDALFDEVYNSMISYKEAIRAAFPRL